MDALVFLVCFTLLCMCYVNTAGELSRKLLSKSVENFDGKIVPNWYLQIGYGTAINCQMQCLRDLKCVSFFYERYSRRCSTHGEVYYNPNDGQPSPGYKYYVPVCELCPSAQGYIYNRALNFCYKLHYDNPKDPIQAREMCQREGGDLVITDTIDKFNHIGWTITRSTFPAANYPGFLIGASDASKSGNWLWTDGKQVDPTIMKWCPGQPSSSKERYVVLIQSNDDPPVCAKDIMGDPKHYVCERPM